MEQEFIKWAEKLVGGTAVVTKEPYGDMGVVYKLVFQKSNFFLKIGSELAKERERIEWLDKKVPIPKIIGFVRIEDKDALLLSAIEGINLAKLSKRWSADKVISELAKVLHKFHAVDIKDCPFGTMGPNRVLVHGDACLPNFIFKNDEFSGYIDLGDMRIDVSEVDLSASVWSLDYNLGSGYGVEFLKAYGVKNATEELAEKLKRQYEEMQKEWGLI